MRTGPITPYLPAVRQVAQQCLAALLPQDCVLCGQASSALQAPLWATHGPVCAACAAHLPTLPVAQCAVCARPLPPGSVSGVPQRCASCLRAAPAFETTIARWRYHFPVDILIQEFKFAHRLSLARALAYALLDGPWPCGDMLIPMPLSSARLRERGFNQAVEITRHLSRITGLPWAGDVCRRVRHGPAQSSLPWSARADNVRHAFACERDWGGRSIIVVDDVMTSGSTLNALAATLKACNATRVSNWVLARAVGEGVVG
jgi:ComF family protein